MVNDPIDTTWVPGEKEWEREGGVGEGERVGVGGGERRVKVMVKRGGLFE